MVNGRLHPLSNTNKTSILLRFSVTLGGLSLGLQVFLPWGLDVVTQFFLTMMTLIWKEYKKPSDFKYVRRKGLVFFNCKTKGRHLWMSSMNTLQPASRSASYSIRVQGHLAPAHSWRPINACWMKESANPMFSKWPHLSTLKSFSSTGEKVIFYN